MEPQIENKLTKKEKRELGRQERHQAEAMSQIYSQRKKIKFWVFGVTLPVLFVGGIIFLITQAPAKPKLPPIIMQGHIEEHPKAHIAETPIPEVIQKHVLEHVDGIEKPGIIIQYNCERYSCESDLVAKLTELVKQYPDNVYLAPNDYDGKIILTKLGKYQTLDNFDEQAIKLFISGN